MAWIMKMLPRKPAVLTPENHKQAGERLFMQNCMSCHGAHFEGSGNNPSLKNIKATSNHTEVIDLLNSGRRLMPAFKQLSEEERNAIATFVLQEKSEYNKPFVPTTKKIDSVDIMPYKIAGYTKFLSSDGSPAISPPWGTLNAIDLNTGEFVWKVPLGQDPKLTARGIPATGTENYGGPVVTAGGILFIAATKDAMLRAFNKRNGKLLWEYKLPAAAFATPSIYELNNKQYLVIACGGGKLGSRSGDSYVAFALPSKDK
ncbi:MAG: c-type cytochrome [Chitinophagaceae bacterium]|nr:c-type cytochrome [Chitinophagaceae bacterium]